MASSHDLLYVLSYHLVSIKSESHLYDVARPCVRKGKVCWKTFQRKQ